MTDRPFMMFLLRVIAMSALVFTLAKIADEVRRYHAWSYGCAERGGYPYLGLCLKRDAVL